MLRSFLARVFGWGSPSRSASAAWAGFTAGVDEGIEAERVEVAALEARLGRPLTSAEHMERALTGIEPHLPRLRAMRSALMLGDDDQDDEEDDRDG